MANARDRLQLRVRHAATPARVARVATMFDEALRALGVADEVGTTLVVENRELVATVRTRTKAGAEAVGAIIKIAQTPTTAPPLPGRSEVAKALARYARDEGRYHPQFWIPRRDAPLVELDETFASVMEGLAEAPPPGERKMRGTTYVYSKVLRVGRVDEHHGYRIRVVVEGRPHELSIGQLAVGPFFDAAKRDAVVKLKLKATWSLPSDREPMPTLEAAEVVGMDDTSPGTGAQVLALAKEHKIISGEDLPEVLASIEESRRGN
jgi:hypothetical protein